MVSMPAVRVVVRVIGFVLILGSSAALAVQEELLERARALVAEAKPFVVKANDVDLPMFDRRAPRKEAFRRLKEARSLYDSYLDANPTMEEKLDAEYVEMMVVYHGIKKDSSLGELEKDDATSAPPSPPATRTLPSAKEALSAVVEYEKAHRGNLPEIQRRYTQFLATFPDPALPEYAEAAERLGKVSDRIKSVFQSTARRDFDSISGSESKEERSIVSHLAADLNQKNPEIRMRAARLLAATRSREATYDLARGVADTDQQLAKVCQEGLLAIGGTSVGENLAKIYGRGSKANQQVAMALIKTLVLRGGREGANQSRAIGTFALSSDPAVSASAFELLSSIGKDAGPGLLVALLGTGDVEKKASVIARIADAKCYRLAGFLAEQFFVPTSGDAAASLLFSAASASIERMGVNAVPYLVDALNGASARQVARVLSKITGLQVEVGEQQKVRDWWQSHKPKDAD